MCSELNVTMSYCSLLGDPLSTPTSPPRNVFARQIHDDPIRIEMGWELMTCIQQNSPIINYLVEYGRTNTSELRTATTEDTYIFSRTFSNNGLGFLQYGEEYWFRVAARNTNGQGPFSITLRATPLSLRIPTGMMLHKYSLI